MRTFVLLLLVGKKKVFFVQPQKVVVYLRKGAEVAHERSERGHDRTVSNERDGLVSELCEDLGRTKRVRRAECAKQQVAGSVRVVTEAVVTNREDLTGCLRDVACS